MGNSPIKKFSDLIAWKEAHKIVLFIYKETKSFPNDERFGLVDQMRRASISITSNIAEGFGRNTAKDKINFYTMAKTSLAELENQCIASRDLGYMHEIKFRIFEQQAETVNKLISSLFKTAIDK
ncbi:MAG: four helix bundle protein [Candidatus Pacebacteria bacterium]|nr:four helix bundle protein [Candidatus Paceibacterota bacterium]